MRMGAIVLIAGLVCAGVQADLPRVSVREGKFVKQGRAFTPLGFQYIRIRPEGPHYVFAPSYYDPAAVEAMFADLEAHGFNVVRIFVGGLELIDQGRLNPRFLDNVCDFLRRATAHHIYVLIVPDWVPGADAYTKLRQPGSAEIQATGQAWLDAAWLEAKAAYLRDFVGAIKSRDASLLSTVFAYEFENEACIFLDQPPFKGRGKFALRGATYDLSAERDIQALMDAGITEAARGLTAAVHEVDLAAMTSYSVFTLRAVGRSGVERMLTDVTGDTRVPVRPLALAKADVSYVDVHMYGPDPGALAADLKTSEWEAVKAECARRGKPILCGEYGTFPAVHPTEEAAAGAIAWYLPKILEAGFGGAIYWTYDCAEQKDVWNAKAGKGLIYQTVCAVAKRVGG